MKFSAFIAATSACSRFVVGVRTLSSGSSAGVFCVWPTSSHARAKQPRPQRHPAAALDAVGVHLEEVEVVAEVEDRGSPSCPSPGPNRSGHNRVPRPIICQNLIFEYTGLKKTRFATSGTSMPVSSMSTEIAMCGVLVLLIEKSSIRLCAYVA